jgi:hypothetical protein
MNILRQAKRTREFSPFVVRILMDSGGAVDDQAVGIGILLKMGFLK